MINSYLNIDYTIKLFIGYIIDKKILRLMADFHSLEQFTNEEQSGETIIIKPKKGMLFTMSIVAEIKM